MIIIKLKIKCQKSSDVKEVVVFITSRYVSERQMLILIQD